MKSHSRVLRVPVVRSMVAATSTALVMAAVLARSAAAAPGDIPGRGFLPDNQGWEKVSPEDKKRRLLLRRDSAGID
jgi:hypothetical protein